MVCAMPPPHTHTPLTNCTILIYCINLQVGPVNLRFTLPMVCASRLSLKYLQILKSDRTYTPQRWVSLS